MEFLMVNAMSIISIAMPTRKNKPGFYFANRLPKSRAFKIGWLCNISKKAGRITKSN
jgi:hypothetical protein